MAHHFGMRRTIGGKPREIALPSEAARVAIAADNDANGRGQTAATRAAKRWRAEGREVCVRMPETVGHDYNDLLNDDYAGTAQMSDLPKIDGEVCQDDFDTAGEALSSSDKLSDNATPAAEAKRADRRQSEGEKQSAILIRLAQSAELFSAPDGTAYADVLSTATAKLGRSAGTGSSSGFAISTTQKQGGPRTARLGNLR